jgi:hypothetical protein
MANKHLATYLSDHLAGSEAALELLEHLATIQADTPLKSLLDELHADVLADRQELETLMARLHVEESRPRKATAWLAEKVTRLKLRLDDPTDGAFHLFEGLEMLGIGIEGKRGLWRALAATSEIAPELQGVDYARLEQRAKEQHDRIETVRLEVAKAALGAARGMADGG